MARHLFGLSPADFAVERVGDEVKLRPGAVGTVWDSYSGGSQLTDLTALDNTPVNVVTASADATVGFYGPDGVSLVYVDFDFGLRFALTAVDLGPALDLKLNLTGGTLSGDLTVPNLTATGLTTLGGALTVSLAAGFSGLVTASAGLTVSGGTLTAGAISAASAALTGASSAASYTATGDVAGATATAATVRGGTGSGGNLALTSTGHATKGKVQIGTFTVDEANNRVGVNNASPSVTLHFIDPAPSATASIRIDNSTAGGTASRAVGIRTSGDAQDRFTIDYDGKLQWGGATGAPDADLRRTGAGALRVTGDLDITGDLTFSSLGIGSTVFARKTAVTGYNATTTLANDPHLFSPTLPANSTWWCQFSLAYTTTSANSGALKVNYTAPAGATVALRAVDATGADTYTLNPTTSDQWGSLAGVVHQAFYNGLVIIGGTAGVFRLQAAQWTSSGTVTNTQVNSYLYMRRVA